MKTDRQLLMELVIELVDSPSQEKLQLLKSQLDKCQNPETCDGTIDQKTWETAKQAYDKIQAFLTSNVDPWAEVKASKNPIHQDKDGQWFFFDECWDTRYGPYATEEIATEKCDAYFDRPAMTPEETNIACMEYERKRKLVRMLGETTIIPKENTIFRTYASDSVLNTISAETQKLIDLHINPEALAEHIKSDVYFHLVAAIIKAEVHKLTIKKLHNLGLMDMLSPEAIQTIIASFDKKQISTMIATALSKEIAEVKVTISKEISGLFGQK